MMKAICLIFLALGLLGGATGMETAQVESPEATRSGTSHSRTLILAALDKVVVALMENQRKAGQMTTLLQYMRKKQKEVRIIAKDVRRLKSYLKYRPNRMHLGPVRVDPYGMECKRVNASVSDQKHQSTSWFHRYMS